MVTRPVATCPLVTQAENGAAASQRAGAGAGAEAGVTAEGITISPRMPGVPQGFVRETGGCGPSTTSSRDRGASWNSHPVPRFCVGGGGASGLFRGPSGY